MCNIPAIIFIEGRLDPIKYALLKQIQVNYQTLMDAVLDAVAIVVLYCSTAAIV